MDHLNKGTLVYVKSDIAASGKELALLISDLTEEEEDESAVRVYDGKDVKTMSLSDVKVMLGVNSPAGADDDRRTAHVFTNTRGYVDLPVSAIVEVVGLSSLTHDLTGLHGLYDVLITGGEEPLYHTPLGKFSFEAQSSDLIEVKQGSTVVMKRFIATDGTFFVLLGSVVEVNGTDIVVDVGLSEYMRFDVSTLAVAFS